MLLYILKTTNLLTTGNELLVQNGLVLKLILSRLDSECCRSALAMCGHLGPCCPAALLSLKINSLSEHAMWQLKLVYLSARCST